MDIELIKAELADAERLLEIQKICFAPHLERYEDYDYSPATQSLERIQKRILNWEFYKITADGVLVGAIDIINQGEGTYKLHMINILPQYQNKGVGQAAIKIAESFFPDAKKWVLETLSDMPNNRHTYEKLGYKFTGKTEKINEKLTLVFYEKYI